MRLDNPYGAKFKFIFVDFPNVMILTKSATLGEIQVTFHHASFGEKSLRETDTAFTLVGYHKYLTVVSINTKRAFTSAGDKIRLPITEVLLHAAVVDLAQSKNL